MNTSKGWNSLSAYSRFGSKQNHFTMFDDASGTSKQPSDVYETITMMTNPNGINQQKNCYKLIFERVGNVIQK